MKKILIGIPVLNNLEMTRACLQKMMSHTNLEPNNLIVEILIIDNGSSENIAEMLLKEFSNTEITIHYRKNPYNMGVAVAWNQILRFSSAPIPPPNFSYNYYVIANNDAMVCKNWLQPLMNVMEADNQVGWISTLENGSPVLDELIEAHQVSKQYRVDPSKPFNTEAIHNSIKSIYAAWGGHDNFCRGVADKLPPFIPFKKDVRSAVCFMVRSEMIDELGFFDEEYWPIGVSEDLEYFLRIDGIFPSTGTATLNNSKQTSWKAGFSGKSIVHHNWCSTHQGKNFDGRKWDKEREKNWQKKFHKSKKYFTTLLS
ncbi:MAG: glycosyltransferase [Chlorobium sp.]|nr:glycosyltransferase [Chlorobium sp.]